MSRWYNKIEHDNEHTLDDYVDRYYQYEDNNKLFYSLTKYIDNEKIKNSWIDIFKYNGIDKEAKIDVKNELQSLKNVSYFICSFVHQHTTAFVHKCIKNGLSNYYIKTECHNKYALKSDKGNVHTCGTTYTPPSLTAYISISYRYTS